MIGALFKDFSGLFGFSEKMYDLVYRQVEPLNLVFLKSKAAVEMNKREKAVYEEELVVIKVCLFSCSRCLLPMLFSLKSPFFDLTLWFSFFFSQEKTEAAKKDIVTARRDLAEAKVLRERKAEYDALARVINRHRDRETSEKELAALNADIAKLKVRG